jgi:hypothetical protein
VIILFALIVVLALVVEFILRFATNVMVSLRTHLEISVMIIYVSIVLDTVKCVLVIVVHHRFVALLLFITFFVILLSTAGVDAALAVHIHVRVPVVASFVNVYPLRVKNMHLVAIALAHVVRTKRVVKLAHVSGHGVHAYAHRPKYR